jgi:hypothetical protein
MNTEKGVPLSDAAATDGMGGLLAILTQPSQRLTTERDRLGNSTSVHQDCLKLFLTCSAKFANIRNRLMAHPSILR